MIVKEDGVLISFTYIYSSVILWFCHVSNRWTCFMLVFVISFGHFSLSNTVVKHQCYTVCSSVVVWLTMTHSLFKHCSAVCLVHVCSKEIIILVFKMFKFWLESGPFTSAREIICLISGSEKQAESYNPVYQVL